MLVPVPGVPGLYVRSALIDIEECADVLGIPPTTLSRMVTDGDISHTRIGKHVRFAPGHIGDFIVAGERRSTKTPDARTRRGSAKTRL
jgi:excisionase family DNA binding protein